MTIEEKVKTVDDKMRECLLTSMDFFYNAFNGHPERVQALLDMPDEHKVMLFDMEQRNDADYPDWCVDFLDYSYDSIQEGFYAEQYFA